MDEPATSGYPAPRLDLATAFFTLLGNAYLVVASAVLGLIAVLVGWIPPRGAWVYRLARLWSWGLLRASGVRLRASFEEPLRRDGIYVVMPNHQSLFDIPALIASFPGQARFLAKQSLFKLPVFGWAIKAGGFISVDRTDRAAAQASFTAAVARLRGGVSIVIFPEEERSLDGRLLPFKRGGFLLGLRTGHPIVPVGIRGALEVRHRESYRIRPGRVDVRYGRPIDASEYGLGRKAELIRLVRERIVALME